MTSSHAPEGPPRPTPPSPLDAAPRQQLEAPIRPKPARSRRTRSSWHPVLRLARRDAGRHRLRTILATALVVLPTTALVAAVGVSQSVLPSRDQALAAIPADVQAVVTATAVLRAEPTFEQIPEGAPRPWFDDAEQTPADEGELASLLADGNRLLPFWNSPELLVTTKDAAYVGVDASGVTDSDAAPADYDAAAVAQSTMQEAGAEALALLAGDLAQGTLPVNDTDIVVTSALAKRLDVGLGDTVTFVAPPDHGMMGMDGRIHQVVENTQQTYQVSAIVTAEQQHAWALPGWMAPLVSADSAGVDGHWLVVGNQPVIWDQVKSINPVQAFAVSRHVLENYPDEADLYPVPIDTEALLLQAVSVLLAGVVGLLLVLFLVTPAFTVSVDQSRRTLGLIAATGGTPRDLRRFIAIQGLAIGVLGGVLGSALGTVAAVLLGQVFFPQRDLLANFPWWILGVSIGLAGVLGIAATVPAAWKAARLDPVDALKDRVSKSFRRTGRVRSVRGRLASVAGPVLIVLAIIIGIWSLAQDAPTFNQETGESGVGLAILPSFITILLAVTGVLLTARALTKVGGRIASRFPVAFRLALRDATDHQARVVPAVCGILVAICAASFFAVQTGSTVANERDLTGEMLTGGRIVLGPQVAAGEAFDRIVLADAIQVLSKEFLITGSESIYATGEADASHHLTAILPDGVSCPEGEYPDTASAIQVGAPMGCLDGDHAYLPGLSLAWMGFTQSAVMSQDALRASGFADKETANVLADGGVIVNNAAYLSDRGTVRVAISEVAMPEPGEIDQVVELPGAFIRGFAPYLTVSPETARELGVKAPAYRGEYLTSERELTPSELAHARDLVMAHTSLVVVVSPPAPYSWGQAADIVPVVLLGILALVAATICLALSRTQTLRDFGTMHAVGATPGFLRRFTFTQALVILGVGVPLGVGTGLALGAYQIAWNRKAGLTGAWLETVALWNVQSVLVLAVVGVGLLTAILLARPPRQLTQRAID